MCVVRVARKAHGERLVVKGAKRAKRSPLTMSGGAPCARLYAGATASALKEGGVSVIVRLKGNRVFNIVSVVFYGVYAVLGLKDDEIIVKTKDIKLIKENLLS